MDCSKFSKLKTYFRQKKIVVLMKGNAGVDAYYCACEVKQTPSLQGKPLAVCQYETWKKTADRSAEMDRVVKIGGAGLIAVSYEARAEGVKRQMSASEARKACPDLITVMVPTKNGKADLSLYKQNGEKVVKVLQEFAGIVEKRSVDEVALDVTEAAHKLLEETPKELIEIQAAEASHFADSDLSLEASRVSYEAMRRGHDGQKEKTSTTIKSPEKSQAYSAFDYLLLAGAVVIRDARAAVRTRLGFSCSAGIAANKILAKVGCGLHKPNQQTIVFPQTAAALLKDLPLSRLPGLGGDLGNRLTSQLNVDTAGALANTPRSILLSAGFQDADTLLAIATGTYAEPVKDRANYKSFGASKTFYTQPLKTLPVVDQWLDNFSQEIFARVQEDRSQRHRAPTNVTISVSSGPERTCATRTEKVNIGWTDSPLLIIRSAQRLIRRWAGTRSTDLDISVLGLGVSNFIDLPATKASVLDLLSTGAAARPRQQHQQQQQPPASTVTSSSPSHAKKKRTIAELLQDQAASATPSAAVVRTTTESCTTTDIDPDIFAELPPDIQTELRDARLRARLLGQETLSTTGNHPCNSLASSTISHRPTSQHVSPITKNNKKKKKKGVVVTGKIDSFFTRRKE